MMVHTVNKKEMFDMDLSNGIIAYDCRFGGYVYEYSECGFTDEIFIGETIEQAFEAYCEINW